jgi:hypothetical protein
MSDINDPHEGDRFTFRRGEIRIDWINNGWVYFVQWSRGMSGGFVEYGTPTRMTLETWREAVAREEVQR